MKKQSLLSLLEKENLELQHFQANLKGNNDKMELVRVRFETANNCSEVMEKIAF